MRIGLYGLLLAVTIGPIPAIFAPAAEAANTSSTATARKQTLDPAAQEFKQEQQARLVYWIFTYRKALSALQQGRIYPVSPYPRQERISELYTKMSPGAQLYALKLQAFEKRVMSEHAPNATVDRATVIEGMRAILDGLEKEQKMLEKMPVAY